MSQSIHTITTRRTKLTCRAAAGVCITHAKRINQNSTQAHTRLMYFSNVHTNICLVHSDDKHCNTQTIGLSPHSTTSS